MPKHENWLKEGITDERGQHDIVLLLLVASVVGLIAVATIQALHGTAVDVGSMGTGLASLVGLGGLGYGAKRLGEKYGSGTDSGVPKE